MQCVNQPINYYPFGVCRVFSANGFVVGIGLSFPETIFVSPNIDTMKQIILFLTIAVTTISVNAQSKKKDHMCTVKPFTKQETARTYAVDNAQELASAKKLNTPTGVAIFPGDAPTPRD